MLRAALAFLISAAVSATAHAQETRVCIEEVSGVCLKYKDAAPAPEPAPAPQVSPAERSERALNLSSADRRTAQTGLKEAGVYTGGVDGAFGPQSRRALRDWQRARGEAATGFLTAGQLAALAEAAALVSAAEEPAAPSPAPEPETAVAEPQPAAETDAAHPVAGRVYEDGHQTVFGTDIAVAVERVDEARARVTLTLRDGGSTLKDDCVVAIEEEIACYMRRNKWNLILLSGRLPRLVATETEAMPQVKNRANREVFTLW
ncbi:MAG: peptidoglycan-binding domain-containing protein [Pseudomonadota bacterium]